MARKKITEQDVKSDGYNGPVNEVEKAKADAIKVRQDIANLCTSIGDRSFVIRQAQGDITTFHTQIDQLREQLRTLEPVNGPQASK